MAEASKPTIVSAFDSAAIADAAALIWKGQPVAVPTETVYGLAADAGNGQAVARIFAAKGRPRFNPLIAHVPGIAEADRHAILPPAARILIEAFWPGPLTIVAPRRPDSPVCDLACAGLNTIALRVPAHEVARALLAQVDFPLAAPSANRSERLSTTTAEAAEEEVGVSAALVLDGGACALGLESTIIGFGDTAILLRPGAIPAEAIEALIAQTKEFERAVAVLELRAITFEGSDSLDNPTKALEGKK